MFLRNFGRDNNLFGYEFLRFFIFLVDEAGWGESGLAKEGKRTVQSKEGCLRVRRTVRPLSPMTVHFDFDYRLRYRLHGEFSILQLLGKIFIFSRNKIETKWILRIVVLNKVTKNTKSSHDQKLICHGYFQKDFQI